eukprot:1160719-Pelagomonas_calceolata.AAC.4
MLRNTPATHPGGIAGLVAAAAAAPAAAAAAAAAVGLLLGQAAHTALLAENGCAGGHSQSSCKQKGRGPVSILGPCLMTSACVKDLPMPHGISLPCVKDLPMPHGISLRERLAHASWHQLACSCHQDEPMV